MKNAAPTTARTSHFERGDELKPAFTLPVARRAAKTGSYRDLVV